jgi:peptidoglycan hydrolase-like protein with peptidoglycan-binding domain
VTKRTVVIVVAAVLTTGAGVVAATGFDWGAAPAAAPAPVPSTATVTKQTLVDTQSSAGELGYGTATSVPGRLAGTVTALPAVGSTVARGQALFRVDDLPVVLLYGTLPAYRPLAVDTKGADVEQFEKNLAALGYSGFTVDDTYSAATATAVKEWQADLGLPETGTVEPGRVVYAAGPVRVDTQEAAVGDPAQPGTALLTYTGSTRVVTVDLEVADRRLAVKGAAVTVTLPDGRTLPGRVAAVRTVVTPADGAGGGSAAPTTTIEVTVTVADQKALAVLDAASVQVAFTASKRPDVLTVPVAALLALAEGGYGVEVVQGRSTRIVPVRTGLFAAGRVEVSGGGLAEGMTVGMPS